MGRLADDILAREQRHFRVNAETGAVMVRTQVVEHHFTDMAQVLREADWMLPPYGRVWIHVE